jgi:hypothetical protein
MKLYLRYGAQLNRQYLRCLKELRDLQAERRNSPTPPSEPKPPQPETEIPAQEAAKPESTINEIPNEANLSPEQARLILLRTEIRRHLEEQATRTS